MVSPHVRFQNADSEVGACQVGLCLGLQEEAGADGKGRAGMDPIEARRREEAIAWFAALRASVMLAEQRAAYDIWRADPQNQAAMDAVHELWGELAVLKDLGPAALPVRRRSGRVVAAAAAAAVILGALGTSWILMSGPGRIETAVGQQKVQSLPDGSLVALNVASRVSYVIGEDRRVVTIGNGEAAFTVKADRDRPFVVRAGDYEVRATGTAFNVRQRDGEIEVSVSEGGVEICAAVGPKAGDVLASVTSGSLLRFPAEWSSGAFASLALSPVSPAQVGEWRTHVVSYEDAPVREVVADLNRYFSRKLVVETPSLLDKQVTIRLQVEDRDRAIGTLASLLNVRIRVEAGQDVLE